MRLVGNRATRHVEAAHFAPVQVNDRAIVTLNIHEQREKAGEVGGDECLAIIGGDEFIGRVEAKGIGGERLASTGIAVAKRRGAAGP